MALKKNFENEYNLKNVTNEGFEFHELLQSWIAEELEMKIREEYYNGVKEVSEENAMKEVINGTKSLKKASEENQKGVADNIYEKENYKKYSKTETTTDYNKLCWSCSATQVKLYKCSGCRKARYCGKQCIASDWKEHMGYCLKVQKRRNKTS